jgi:hypothetical protein
MAKHTHFILGGRVTRAKSVYMENIYPAWAISRLFLSGTRQGEFNTRLHHVNSHPGLLLVFIALPSNSPPYKQAFTRLNNNYLVEIYYILLDSSEPNMAKY